MTFEEIRQNKEIATYISSADRYLQAIGYTEHSFAHVGHCVDVVEYILKNLSYNQHTIELAKIAAYMHDIGNIINREDHAKTGAIMAFRLLDKMGMPTEDIASIIMAIGNHDESSAYPVNVISSALILADKTDVRRSRVRKNISEFGIHDRVNYAVMESKVVLDAEKKTFTLNLTIDNTICSIMDYFEIFLSRMMLCKKAAAYFNLTFHLCINKQSLL